MASVFETGEEIASSEIAKLHFNGNGSALGWVAVMTQHDTDGPTIAMHQLLAQEMASYSGVEGRIRRLFGGAPVLAGPGSDPVPGRFHRGPRARVTATGNPIMILEFDEVGEAFDPSQQDELAEWVRPLWGKRPRILAVVHSLPGATNLDTWFLGAFGRALDKVQAAPQFGATDRLTAGVYIAWQRPDGQWRPNPPLRRVHGALRLAYQIIMSCQAADS